jgi:hypothetical protein
MIAMRRTAKQQALMIVMCLLLGARLGLAEISSTLDITSTFVFCVPGTCSAYCSPLGYAVTVTNHTRSDISIESVDGHLASLTLSGESYNPPFTAPILPASSAFMLVAGASQTWSTSSAIPTDRFWGYHLTATVVFPGAGSIPAASDTTAMGSSTIPIVGWSISGYVYDAIQGSDARLGGVSVTATFGYGSVGHPSTLTSQDGSWSISGQGHDDGTAIWLSVSGPGYQTAEVRAGGSCPHTAHVANLGLYPRDPQPTATSTNMPTPSPTLFCHGDADRNGFVNGLDYQSVRDHFGEPACEHGDADGNCFVNPEDYRTVRDNYGQGCGA